MASTAEKSERPGHGSWQQARPASLSLRATSDGWALLDRGRGVVYQASGLGARDRCLMMARDCGVLVLTA